MRQNTIPIVYKPLLPWKLQCRMVTKNKDYQTEYLKHKNIRQKKYKNTKNIVLKSFFYMA